MLDLSTDAHPLCPPWTMCVYSLSWVGRRRGRVLLCDTAITLSFWAGLWLASPGQEPVCVGGGGVGPAYPSRKARVRDDNSVARASVTYTEETSWES